MRPRNEFEAPIAYDPEQLFHNGGIFAAMRIAGPDLAAQWLCTTESDDRALSARTVRMLKPQNAAERAQAAALAADVRECFRFDAND